MRSRIVPALGLFALAFLSGCGGNTLAPVKGRVLCDGQPVKEAAITFNPVPAVENAREAGKPATGFTDDAGNFVLSTFKPLDGALVGKHKVTVTLDDTNKARCKRSKTITLEVVAGQNEFTIDLDK